MIKLSKIPTEPPKGFTKKATAKKTEKITRRIAVLQQLLYAQNTKSILVVFQGMDATGKDGATREVFRYCSPTGVSYKAFKKPSSEEMAHDFLWRVHRHAPKKGRIGIFNRSHYEDILIQRVHRWIDDKQVADRMKAINAFERNLVRDNHTTVLKFYMHISKKRQKEKLIERIEVKEKNWKHNDADWAERRHWDRYMECYEYAINESKIPWIVAPVDKRWYRDYFIASKVLETLESLNLHFPVLNVKRPSNG